MATLINKIPTYSVSKTAKNALSNYNKSGNTQTNKINALISSAQKMGDFSTDKSSYYQQAYNALKDTYTNRGRQAMQNTIADAAVTNTGGFGNSYGTTAGNQAFQAQLNMLSAKIPSLYATAASEFQTRKSDIYNQVNALNSERSAAMDKALQLYNIYQQQDYNNYLSNYNRVNANNDIYFYTKKNS